jgi:hypothetical protein
MARGEMFVECGLVLVDFVEDEVLRLLWIEEDVETLATRFALKRSFRVSGDQIAKLRNERRFHKEFNKHDNGRHDSFSQDTLPPVSAFEKRAYTPSLDC